MSISCNISVRVCCAGELIGVEYLFSQTGAVLQQDLGWDPDTPDGTGEAEEDWNEGFEEEEELEEIRLLSHHHALLLQPVEPRGAPAAAVAEAPTSQSEPTPAPAPPAEEDDDVSTGIPVFISSVRVIVRRTFMSCLCAFLQDVMGPDGHGGYHHVTALANALADLRHRRFVTQRQARVIIALWQRLSDRDKAPVAFPPPTPGQARAGPHQDDPTAARSHSRSGQCEAVSTDGTHFKALFGSSSVTRPNRVVSIQICV